MHKASKSLEHLNMDFGSARHAYHSKLSSLTTSLRSLYDDRDDLIEIMRDDPVSERFIPAHIDDFYSTQTITGKDRAVDHILSELNSTQESLNELMRQRSQLAGSLKNKQQSEEFHKEKSKAVERKLKDSQQDVEDLRRSVSQLNQNYEDKLKQQQTALLEYKHHSSKEIKDLKKALEQAIKDAYIKDIEVSKLSTSLAKETNKRELLEKHLDDIKRDSHHKEAYYSDTETRLQMSLQQSTKASTSLQIAEERINQLSISLDELQNSKQEQEEKFLEFYSQVKASIEEEQRGHVEANHKLKQRLARKLQKAKNRLADSEISRVELEDAFNKCSGELEGAKLQYEQLCKEHEDRLEHYELDLKQVQANSTRQIDELKARHENEQQQANRHYASLIEQKMKEFQQEVALIKAKARERENDIAESYEQRLRDHDDHDISKAEHTRLLTLAENQVREEMRAANAVVLDSMRQQMLNAEKDWNKRIEDMRTATLNEQQQIKGKLQDAETQNLLMQKDVDRYVDNLNTARIETSKANYQVEELREAAQGLKDKLVRTINELDHAQRAIVELTASKSETENKLEELNLSKAETELKAENKLDEFYAELKSLRQKKLKQQEELDAADALNEDLQDRLNAAESEALALTKENQRLTYDLAELTKASVAQVNALKADYQKRLEASMMENEATKVQLESTANRLAKANLLADQANEQIKSLRGNIEGLNSDNSALVAEIKGLEAEVSNRTAHNQNISREFDASMNGTKRLHMKKLKKLLQTASGLKAELSETAAITRRALATAWKGIAEALLTGGEELEQKSLMQQRDFLMMLRDKQQELEEERANCEDMKQKMTQLFDQAVTEMKQTKQNTQAEIKRLSEELKAQETELEKYREEISDLQDDREQLHQELEKVRDDHEMAKQQASVSLAKQEKRMSKCTTAELTKANQQFAGQLAQLTTRIDELKADSLARFKEYEAEAERLKSHYQETLQRTLNRTRDIDEELSNAEQTTQCYSEQAIILEQELKALQKRASSKQDSLEFEIADLQSTLNQERAKFKLYKQEKTREIESLRIKVRRFEEQ